MPSSRQVASVSSAGLAVEQRVLALHGRDRVDGVRPADRLGRGLGQAEVAHLAALDQPPHRAHRLLDRHLGVDAVLVVEIDHVDAEAREARVAGLRHVGGAAVHEVAPCRRALWTWPNLVASTTPFRRPLSARPSSVSFCPQPYMSEESRKSTPRSRAAWMTRDRLLVVALAVGARHGHQAEADGGDAEAVLAESAMLHWMLLAHA